MKIIKRLSMGDCIYKRWEIKRKEIFYEDNTRKFKLYIRDRKYSFLVFEKEFEQIEEFYKKEDYLTNNYEDIKNIIEKIMTTFKHEKIVEYGNELERILNN